MTKALNRAIVPYSIEECEMTPKERDMLQFAVWVIAFDKPEKQRDVSEIQFGYTHKEWVELWSKILGNKL